MLVNIEIGDFWAALAVRIDKNGRPYACGRGVSVFFAGKSAKEVRRMVELEKTAEETAALDFPPAPDDDDFFGL